MKNQSENFKNIDSNLPPQPFFSIVITTYNRSDVIKRALDSLVKQTEDDWEAIIVDDGSSDDTHDRILPYLISNSKIRYLQKAHTGEAASKNEGAFSSCGKYISFLDSDDEYKPRHLEFRKNMLTEYPQIQFLYGGVKIIGNQFVPDIFNPGKLTKLGDCVIGGTFFVERSLFVKLNGFRNMYLGTDTDLFSRIKNSGAMMKETLVKSYIYHHEMQDSITNKLYREILTKPTDAESLNLHSTLK